MQEQALLSKVRRIEIKTKGLSRHLFSGAYHSVFKGRGMSFSEVREYSYGDDVRHIDWNVTARSEQAYVKVFEEERELSLMLVIDISNSTYFGSVEQSKSERIAELASILAFSASQNQDKVGLLLFSHKVHLYIPPKKGRQHILRIIREILVDRTDRGETNLQLALEYLRGTLKKRSICFILSDFLCSLPESHIKFIARRHDLISMQILDPLEELIPDVGILPVKDSESNSYKLIDTSDKELNKEIQSSYHKNIQNTRQTFLRANAEYIYLDVKSSYIKVLLQFFKSRKR
ncbi:MAG: DUF58 domain-containing protein [Saprospiraceae bacterium]|nr:DUF58 domain-containing protein [Saprospiraceae bacterium]